MREPRAVCTAPTEANPPGYRKRSAAVPPVKEHWLFGSAAPLAQAPHRFVAELSADHGGIAPFRILHRRCVAVSDPEYVQHILVSARDCYARSFHSRNLAIITGNSLLTTEGDVWWKRRRHIQPSFKLDCMKRLVPAVCCVIGRLFDRWETRPLKRLSVLHDMQVLTMSAMSRMLLSADIGQTEVTSISAALREGLRLIRRRNTSWARAPLWLPTKENRKLHACRGVIDAFAGEHVSQRLERPRPELPDILNALIESKDPETGERLSPEALVEETKTLFLAGYETTAIGLCWALHLISRHPEAAARWQEELDRVLDGRCPEWDDLPNLTYTAQIIHEALRLYPPVYNMGRECVSADEVGGRRIAKGTLVILSIFGMHRDPVWGDDVDAFRPERFEPGRVWPKRAFLPFGSGKHVCLGNHFAVTEMMVALAMLGQRYRFEATDDQPVGVSAQITLLPDRDITLRMIRRI